MKVEPLDGVAYAAADNGFQASGIPSVEANSPALDSDTVKRLGELSTYLNFAYGAVMKTAFHSGLAPARMRKNFDLLSGSKPTSASTRVDVGGIKGELIAPDPNAKTTILYLHGGGFFMGSIAAYRAFALKIAKQTNARVLLIDYRLAPENPYPAALDDAVKAYRWLLERYPASELVIGGDSAGGGLTLSTFLRLRAEGVPLPSKLFAISPAADLTGTSPTIESNARRDRTLSRRNYTEWLPWYHQGRDLEDPYLSPALGSFEACPPLLLFVGDQEVLLNDSLAVAERARKAGANVRVEIGKDMQHVWPFTLPWLRESREALDTLGAFLKR